MVFICRAKSKYQHFYIAVTLTITSLEKEIVRLLATAIVQRFSAGKLLDLLQSLHIWKELHTKVFCA